MQLLVLFGANVNVNTSNGENALHFACLGDSFGVADFLVQRGIDINRINVDGITPLWITAYYGHWEVCICMILNALG